MKDTSAHNAPAIWATHLGNKFWLTLVQCIRNWPLPIGAFQDQGKQLMINIPINIARLGIPIGGRKTSWLFTSVAEKLNLGLPTVTVLVLKA